MHSWAETIKAVVHTKPSTNQRLSLCTLRSCAIGTHSGSHGSESMTHRFSLAHGASQPFRCSDGKLASWPWPDRRETPSSYWGSNFTSISSEFREKRVPISTYKSRAGPPPRAPDVRP